MIRFANNDIIPRWIIAVRVAQTSEGRHEVRLRTLDGREYTETFDNRILAERARNEILYAIAFNRDYPERRRP